MPTEYLKIAGGTVYDPANGIDGQVRDIWVSGGKIVEAPTDPQINPDRTLDARGLVVMPGGVDMHCHIAGPKVRCTLLVVGTGVNAEGNPTFNYTGVCTFHGR